MKTKQPIAVLFGPVVRNMASSRHRTTLKGYKMTLSSFRAWTFGITLALPVAAFAQYPTLTGTVGAIFH